MKIFNHHIYEFKKGLRNLVLCTLSLDDTLPAINKLYKYDISNIVWEVSDNKVNIFFGNSECIEVIKSFNKKSLTQLTSEEDFILGIMLGYDRLLQCKRYLERKD